jgi:Flp pilus assembly protein TadG
VLLTLSLGGIDYGNLFNGYQSLVAATRVGAETARNDTTCQAGIQVLNTPQVSTACVQQIQNAMKNSGSFSPALTIPTPTLACYCDSAGSGGTPAAQSTITCGNFSCASAGRGFNEVFVTIIASQSVTPLLSWPRVLFPSTLKAATVVRLQ